MSEKCKTCGSCGMPLEKAEDFARGDTAAAYCRYCTDSAGRLLPFQEILDMNARFYMESQGITEAAATQMALDFLQTLPAWKKSA